MPRGRPALKIRGIVKVMATPEHVERLRADVDEWNDWRADLPDIRPDLSGANLHGANLVMADLSYAILRGADLTLANLRGADLRFADLRGANMVGAQMIGADIQSADLRGTDLRTAEDLTPEQLDETIGDEGTLVPEHTPRPLRWSSELSAR